MIRALFIFLSIFLCVPCLSISENDYRNQWTKSVLPFYRAAQMGDWQSKDGIRIHYQIFRNPSPKGHIVLVPGREPAAKHGELVYDLQRMGYSVYLYDHRGQGFSGRMTSDPQIGVVHKFDDYVSDLEYFVRNIVKAKKGERFYMMAHSMGGTVGALYLASHPEAFDAVVFSAPMWRMNTSPFPAFVARALVGTLVLIGKGDQYGPGKGPYNPAWPFEGNDVTRSEVRFWMRNQIVTEFPEIALGGASNRWVSAAFKATGQVAASAPQISTPVMVLQASQDQVVKNEALNEICKTISQCRVYALKDAQHEIFMERDSIRNEAIGKMVDFFTSTQVR